MCPKPEASASGVTDDGPSQPSRFGSADLQNELLSLGSIVGRKWNLVIIERLLANGSMGFSDMLDAIDGISSKVLSESLEDLEEVEFVNRSIVSERPFRVEYTVTDHASILEPLIASVRRGELDGN